MKNFEEIMSERKNRIEARKDELIRRSLLSEEFLEMIQKNKRPFDLLMSYYQCAVMEIETKFRVLNQEYSLEYDKNPIEGIKTRIKSYDSIVRKIRRKNIPMSLTAIEENIKDIAGVRVICSFPEDIYELADSFLRQDDIVQIQKQIRKQFGSTPLNNKNYGKIINEKHFTRICNLIDPSKVVCGGDNNPGALQIAPTVMDNVTFGDAVMQEEIFGPVLPVLTYDSLDEAIEKVNSMAHPLALYIFTSDKEAAEKVTSRCGFGGGCVNDTIIHLATSEMGFGGFGESGMGSYHGKDGFHTFSHYKSIVDKKTWLDLPMRYQPYRKIYEKLLRKFLK